MRNKSSSNTRQEMNSTVVLLHLLFGFTLQFGTLRSKIKLHDGGEAGGSHLS